MQERKIFTDEYEKYMRDVQTYERLYSLSPSDSNWLKLSELKRQNWSVEERFTESYLREYEKQSEERELTFEEEFNWLWRSIKIDMKANSGQISEITRSEMHRDNDDEIKKLKRNE